MLYLAKPHIFANCTRDMRAVWGRGSGRHAAKAIASVFGIGVSTAKSWLIDGAPPMRRRQIAIEMVAEARRLQAELADIERRYLGEINETDLAAAVPAARAGAD